MADAVLPPMPAIERTEIDGVPTFWTDEPGPLIAALVFRVGRSDEPTPLGGISHIAEHLALAGLGIQDYDHNGFVDGTRTLFTSAGKADEVIAFLNAVVDGLSDPPLDRLLVERRILREEREQRGPSIGGAMRWYRFGYDGHGHGLGPDDDELGLDWLGPDRVRAWSADRFTRQNAALWLSKPPPGGLHLPLGEGRRHEVAAPAMVPGVTFPSHLRWDGPGATVSFLSSRTPAINMVSNIAHRRMRQQLRFDHGLVYDVEFEYEPLGPDTAHVMFGAESPPERKARVVGVLVDVLDELARNGPTEAELAGEVDGFIRRFDERDGRLSVLDAITLDHLWDGPVRSVQGLLDVRKAVTPDDAAAVLHDALPSLLALVDGDTPDGRFAEYPAWTPDEIPGREHGPAGFFLPGRRPKERLIAGPDGISATVSPTERMTIRYRDCVAVIHEGPHVRRLLSRDGTTITVDGSLWKDGQRLVEDIDAATPAELVACAEHGIGGLEDPDDEGDVTTP
jgi:zinc protease